MAKNNRKSEKNNELESESAIIDPSKIADEPASSETSRPERTGEQPSEEQITPSTENESSSEDLLEDVRRSLIEEEETDKTKKESKWWRRLGKKQKNKEPELSAPMTEVDLPATSLEPEIAADQKQATEPDESEQQIDDLIDMLKTEHQESEVESVSIATEVEIPPEPDIDIEQLKEQAFRPSTPGEESESDVRSIALGGGEEVFVEVEAKTADTVDERLKGLENALRPYRSYLYMVLAFLGVVMAVVASLLIFNAYRQSRPQPTPHASNLPYPVAVSLPGGWSFNLGRS